MQLKKLIFKQINYKAINFRIWNSLNVSGLSETQLQELKNDINRCVQYLMMLSSGSAKAIPAKMLKAKINLLKTLDFDPKTIILDFYWGRLQDLDYY